MERCGKEFARNHLPRTGAIKLRDVALLPPDIWSPTPIGGKDGCVETLLHEVEFQLQVLVVVPKIFKLVGIGFEVIEFTEVVLVVNDQLITVVSVHGAVSR